MEVNPNHNPDPLERIEAILAESMEAESRRLERLRRLERYRDDRAMLADIRHRHRTQGVPATLLTHLGFMGGDR